MADDIPVVYYKDGKRIEVGRGTYDVETGEVTATLTDDIFMTEEVNGISIYKENN